MPIAVTILESRVEFVEQPFVKPLIISSGAITHLTEARVTVLCRANDRMASGHGSIYLSDLWAWPDPSRSHAQRDQALRRICSGIAADLPARCGGRPAHPLELGLQLHQAVCADGGADAAVPVLARAMCLSPFDAAIHDAAGLALDCPAFDLYCDDQPLPSADPWLAPEGACAAIRRTLQPPRKSLPAWILVGKDDDLDRDMRPWAITRGYHCFKIKIMGRDNAVDVARTIAVFRAAQRFGVTAPRLSLDSNEANPSAESVRDYLLNLQADAPDAYDALQYLEQPTGRDIRKAVFDWKPVAALKPVLLDEGLTAMELMEESRLQGWSGFALKTCKGHSFALVAAAWACRHGMLIAMQDLTNPGFALLHAALFAARLPTLNGVELNSPQFTPDANGPWLPRLAALFEPRDGNHQLPDTMPPGLGSSL